MYAEHSGYLSKSKAEILAAIHGVFTPASLPSPNFQSLRPWLCSIVHVVVTATQMPSVFVLVEVLSK